MGDDKNCLSSYQPRYCVLNFSFVIYIKRSSGFVQKNDWCILQQSSGNREPLTLTARKRGSVFTDHRLIAVGEF